MYCTFAHGSQPVVIPSNATTGGCWFGEVNRRRVEGPPQRMMELKAGKQRN
jgi:hypothetical protein